MADDGTMEALKALDRDLAAVTEALRYDREGQGSLLLAQISRNPLLEDLSKKFQELLDKPPRREESRDALLSGKVQIAGEEWSLNKDFQEIILNLADELDLDEVEATKLALQAEQEESVLRRPRRQCAHVRFHQQRKYLLNCMMFLLQLSKEEDELLDDGFAEELGSLRQYVDKNVLRTQVSGPGVVVACTHAMRDIRSWLNRLTEQRTGASVLGRTMDLQLHEIIEYTHLSLMAQHELLAIILSYAIEKNTATRDDFVSFIREFKQAVRYDFSTVHLVPVLGSYFAAFGSTEGNQSIETVRQLNDIVCQQSENETRMIPFFGAFVKAWWIAEYSGWYGEDAAGSALLNVNLDDEDKQRSKHFTEALKDGAFDFMLAVVADAKFSEWQDPARHRLRQWLQKRTPALPQDTVPFSEALQSRLAAKLETFVDAFISNMPDVLRKLKVDEDEQRQTRHNQNQDLDLERFLLIIAYTYEDRPEAAEAFWSDPENNLAGFLHWASRRATTPLQIVFCEMLQCLSDDPASATSAHGFLQDEGHQLRRSPSISWAHILKELEFFAQKIREKSANSQAHPHRNTKLSTEQAESEPEMTMLHEAYLRLMTKIATHSEHARLFLVQQSRERIYVLLFGIISSFVTPQIRACAFQTLSALIGPTTLDQRYRMWRSHLESCLIGGHVPPGASNRALGSSPTNPTSSSHIMEALFQEMSPHYDVTTSFIQFLTVLVTLPDEFAPLNDVLPYPEDLGVSFRMRSGIEPYVDFVLGHIFSVRLPEFEEHVQQRTLRFYCLEFALRCVASFNEDLLILGNKSKVDVDSAIRTTDLKSYATLHPFARVMEWMYDGKFIKIVLDTLRENPADIGQAKPDSTLILGVLRAIELISRALDLQATYLGLVRPMQKPRDRSQSRSVYIPVPNGAYTSIEDGLVTSLTLISDLGGYCGIGHPDLTMASLKLLRKISESSRIISALNMGPSSHPHRNKAIVALQEHGDAETIAGSFIAEFHSPLDFRTAGESMEYQIKTYILDFLYSCLQATPNQPTIAHLLLGFRCGGNMLEIEPGSSLDQGTALFHVLLSVMIEVPIKNDDGAMVSWLVNLKYKVLRIFKILWTSPLSKNIILDELRENDFLFHILLQGLVTQQNPIWDGHEANEPNFLMTLAAQSYVDYLAMRAMALEYISHELCSVARGQDPALKRRIFDALGGQIKIDTAESIPIPSVFEFRSSLAQIEDLAAPEQQLARLKQFDTKPCDEKDEFSNDIHNIDKLQEILLLKRNLASQSGQLALQQDILVMDAEEDELLRQANYHNQFQKVTSYGLQVLKAWTRLLIVMTDVNDFKGTNKISFILQILQATLPLLETYGSESPHVAYELARLARVLLHKLDFASMTPVDKQSRAVENLVSDKLFQLLQVCLSAIAKWFGTQELRAVYYSICYLHIAGLLEHDQGVRSDIRKTAKTIQIFGEKLLNVVCDDALGGDAECQSAALILLGTLVQLGKQENDEYVVEALNRLNFISILVDSLRGVLEEWVDMSRTGYLDQQHYLNAKLALLLYLCQTRVGAKYVIHANLFRAVELSGLFAVDPELQVDSQDVKALRRHYDLLVKVARIIGVALISRGSHNLLQGRRFLTEHRMLIMHVLKRSVGIGAGMGQGESNGGLTESIHELADAFMVIITATGFVEFEMQQLHQDHNGHASAVFH